MSLASERTADSLDKAPGCRGAPKVHCERTMAICTHYVVIIFAFPASELSSALQPDAPKMLQGSCVLL